MIKLTPTSNEPYIGTQTNTTLPVMVALEQTRDCSNLNIIYTCIEHSIR